MKKNSLIDIVNEEINKFDFLNNDKFLKEQEQTDLLQNEDLQKQFICDALLNRNDKVKVIRVTDAQITGNWDERNTDDATRISLEYFLDVQYVYDSQKEPLLFKLNFFANEISISVDGWHNPSTYDSDQEGDSWFDSFDWNDIDVTMETMNGEELTFTAFEKAPPRIQTLFIREFTQHYIENETLDIRTPEIKDKAQNIPYC